VRSFIIHRLITRAMSEYMTESVARSCSQILGTSLRFFGSSVRCPAMDADHPLLPECHDKVSGLFVPLHFRSRERKVHRENFRSCRTFVPWNIRSRGAKSPKNFRSMELSHPWNFRSTNNFRALITFAPVELDVCWQTFVAVYL